MSRSKKWIIAACVLLGAGVLICLGTLFASGFDYKKLGTVQYTTKAVNIEDDFEHITIEADQESVALLPSEDGACRVVFYETSEAPHTAGVQDGTLSIGSKQNKWQWTFGVAMESPTITVFLPKEQYGTLLVEGDTGDLTIPENLTFGRISADLETGDVECRAPATGTITLSTDTGDIRVSDLTASGLNLASETGEVQVTNVQLTEDLKIEEETGDVWVEHVSCRNLISEGDTGSLTMTSVTAGGAFQLERESGDVELQGCDAEEITIETDTGSVTGTLLTEKIFITETDTGSVDVPKSVTGGRCEITTDIGDIRIEIGS